MSDEHDGDSTSPDLGAHEEHTNPGQGAADAFDVICGALVGATSALRKSAALIERVDGVARWTALRSLAVRAGEVGVAGHDLARIAIAVAREEENASRKGIP